MRAHLVLSMFLFSLQVSAEDKLLLRFVQISDTQIVDEESPARVVRLDQRGVFNAAWRPQEAYGTQALDLTLQAIDKIHRDRPIQLVIQTGDAVDSAQYNELRWFIDTMEGKWVDPDSGDKDGYESALAASINPNIPFQAHGLNSDIPWYTVYGNHDGLSVGNFPVEDLVAPLPAVLAKNCGLHDLDITRNFLDPLWDQSPTIITAKQDLLDEKTLGLDRTRVKAGPIKTDLNRRFISRRDFIEEHMEPKSTSQPSGHGFTQENLEKTQLYYKFKPKADVPILFIVMDSIQEKPEIGRPAFAGILSRHQWDDFIKPAIEDARNAGDYVILFSHHPSKDFDGALGAFPSEVTQSEFRDYLMSQPHILAHVTGHVHRHRVEHVSGGLYPYSEVTTGSIIDYPHEFRIFEIYASENGGKPLMKFDETVSFLSLDPESKNPMAEEIRRRSMADATKRGLIPAPQAPIGVDHFFGSHFLSLGLDTEASDETESRRIRQTALSVSKTRN